MNCKKRLCAALLALVPFTAFSQTAVNAPTAPVAAAADKSVSNALQQLSRMKTNL